MNTSQYLEMRRQPFNNDGIATSVANAPDLLAWDTTRNTNWQKWYMGSISHMTNAQASLSGGNNNTQFLIGGGYTRQTTVLPGTFYDQIASLNFNLHHMSTNGKFLMDFHGEYSNDHNFMPATDPTVTIVSKLSPDAPPIYLSSGNLNWANSTWTNPASYLLSTADGTTNNLIGSANVSYKLFNGLYLKSLLGYTDVRLNQFNQTPFAASNPAYATINSRSATVANSELATWIIEPQINYSLKYKGHSVDMLLGTTFQENVTNSYGVTGTGFTSDALMRNIL
jgi:hypothetical protein